MKWQKDQKNRKKIAVATLIEYFRSLLFFTDSNTVLPISAMFYPELFTLNLMIIQPFTPTLTLPDVLLPVPQKIIMTLIFSPEATWSGD